MIDGEVDTLLMIFPSGKSTMMTDPSILSATKRRISLSFNSDALWTAPCPKITLM
jgi:hypothetical protein